ncbi:hypothetical protein B0T25DRAFT_605164 [Lasiosphaeria hispida]|uniref:Uncharacterized protein n=1 Tax=Lasiosphaeria hispida TaxID=260671 RepID=A0AAJ0HN93_9PEZI|nr:hypothetical protein B0T25DRAFT_605164 [Lasiosphaeria hispida]
MKAHNFAWSAVWMAAVAMASTQDIISGVHCVPRSSDTAKQPSAESSDISSIENWATTIIESLASEGVLRSDPNEPTHGTIDIAGSLCPAALKTKVADPMKSIFTRDELCVYTCTYTYTKAETPSATQPEPPKTPTPPQTPSPPESSTPWQCPCTTKNSELYKELQTAPPPDVSYTDIPWRARLMILILRGRAIVIKYHFSVMVVSFAIILIGHALVSLVWLFETI